MGAYVFLALFSTFFVGFILFLIKRVESES